MDLETWAAQTWEYTAFKDWMAKNKNKIVEMFVEERIGKPAVRMTGKAVRPAWTNDKDTIYYRGSYFRVIVPTQV